MEDNQTNEQQAAVSQVYNYAAGLMVRENKNSAETIEALVSQGLDEESATIVVNNLEQQIADARKEKAKKDMLYGALWCIGGLIITAVTYSAASGGGTYVVTWGAIIFGAIQFFRGLSNS